MFLAILAADIVGIVFLTRYVRRPSGERMSAENRSSREDSGNGNGNGNENRNGNSPE